MRYILPLILVVFISSCGTNQIRFVRLKGQAREVVETRPADKQIPSSVACEVVQQGQNATAIDQSDLLQNNPEYFEQDPNRNFWHSSEAVFNDNAVNSNEEEDERITAAKSAEQSARKARKNLRLSVIFLGLSFIPFLSIFFFLPALILLIIGTVHYFMANSARYITPAGEDMLRSSRIYLLVWMIILLLFILLTAWLLFMFL